VTTVDGSKSIDDLYLSVEFLLFCGIVLGCLHQVLIDKIIEARQCSQPVLPAKFVEAGDAAFPIANDVECRDVDLVPCFVDL